VASPPALPRREGAGVLWGYDFLLFVIVNVFLPIPIAESAPSLRGRAGGEAVYLTLTYLCNVFLTAPLPA
jgi:hypothetical protein